MQLGCCIYRCDSLIPRPLLNWEQGSLRINTRTTEVQEVACIQPRALFILQLYNQDIYTLEAIISNNRNTSYFNGRTVLLSITLKHTLNQLQYTYVHTLFTYAHWEVL